MWFILFTNTCELVYLLEKYLQFMFLEMIFDMVQALDKYLDIKFGLCKNVCQLIVGKCVLRTFPYTKIDFGVDVICSHGRSKRIMVLHLHPRMATFPPLHIFHYPNSWLI